MGLRGVVCMLMMCMRDSMACMYVCHAPKPMVDAHEGPVTGEKMAFFENL